MSLLLIAPYPDLYERAAEVTAESYENTIVEQGDLQIGLQKAIEIIDSNDVDVVISRGGTASLLKQHLHKIVIEIRVTGYDLLRAIYPHYRQTKKIAVVGYENIINGARSISSIIDASIGVFTIDQNNNVEDVVNNAVQWGADIIIGDVVSTQLGREKGVEVELILSGREAILDALQEAEQIHEQLVERAATMQRLNSIIEHSDNGIVYIDSEGVIKQINKAALDCLQKSSGQLLNRKIEDTPLPEKIKKNFLFKNKGETLSVVQLGSKTIYVEATEISVGSKSEGRIAFFQDTGKIQRLEAQIRKELSEKGLQARYTFEGMISNDPINLMTIAKAKQCSITDSTILLLGETGTGKEFFAQSIHNHSLRKDGPFVAVNCAALPDTLLESELFGYAEGAFTGANRGGKQGLFEMAHLGTIFLDEINEMSYPLQARFLRVLQEKEIMRVGDDKVISVDVRVIAATNKNLYKEVLEGRFRSDLFYRIKVLDIEVVSLRRRPKDIIPLFDYFIAFFCEKYGYSTPDYNRSFLEKLKEYRWPGNIRELKNFAEKFVILSSVNTSQENLIDELISNRENAILDETGTQRGIEKKKKLQEVEIEHINHVLSDVNYNISEAARILGINRGTLRRKINM